MIPNFPYLPFHDRQLKGLDLLADYLWPPRTTSATATPTPPANTSSSVSPQVSPADSTSAENVTTPEVNDTTLIAAGTLVPPTEFMIFMGDFIYADVPAYFGDDKEAYQRLYRRNYNSPSFRKVYERLRKFHIRCTGLHGC